LYGRTKVRSVGRLHNAKVDENAWVGVGPNAAEQVSLLDRPTASVLVIAESPTMFSLHLHSHSIEQHGSHGSGDRWFQFPCHDLILAELGPGEADDVISPLQLRFDFSVPSESEQQICRLTVAAPALSTGRTSIAATAAAAAAAIAPSGSAGSLSDDSDSGEMVPSAGVPLSSSQSDIESLDESETENEVEQRVAPLCMTVSESTGVRAVMLLDVAMRLGAMVARTGRPLHEHSMSELASSLALRPLRSVARPEAAGY
jgi:hypothetical protein